LMTVSADLALVERQLVGGWLRCPQGGCGGVLRGHGHARERVVETGLAGRGQAQARFAPRRVRCDACGRTQVLLPGGFFSRRADGGVVIGRAVEMKADGDGHRKIAVMLGRPASTVRGWLRSAAGAGVDVLRAVAAEIAPDPAAVHPKPAGVPLADLVAALSALAAAVGARWRQKPPAWYSVGAAACRCRLLQVSWWARDAQHELALMPAWLAQAGSAAGP
jgi:hypothetical protein